MTSGANDNDAEIDYDLAVEVEVLKEETRTLHGFCVEWAAGRLTDEVFKSWINENVVPLFAA